MKKTPNKSKKFIGTGFEIMIGVSVLVFLGFHTINFFQFVFPPEKYYLSILGFALTSAAVIAYFYIFKFTAEGDTQKTIAIIMVAVSVFGEIVAAGMGMQVEAWEKVGYVLAESDIDLMILLVQALSLVHFIALILYYGLDDMKELFGDEDGDGVRNAFDRDYRPKKASASETKQVKK